MAKKKSRMLNVIHLDGRRRTMSENVFNRLGQVIYKGQLVDRGGFRIDDQEVEEVPSVSAEAKAAAEAEAKAAAEAEAKAAAEAKPTPKRRGRKPKA